MLEKMKSIVQMISDCYPKISNVHRWVSDIRETTTTTKNKKKSPDSMWIRRQCGIPYTFTLWLCASILFFCLNRTTIVRIYSIHKKVWRTFRSTKLARTSSEQLYADAEMSRHTLCARIQTFYISLDFGITRVWNRKKYQRQKRNRKCFGNSSTSQLQSMPGNRWM